MILHRMIVIHVEWRPGCWPNASIRLAPQPGDRVLNGGEPGRLIRCPLCEEGTLHVPDRLPPAAHPNR